MSIRINGKKYINGTVVRANPVEETTGTLNKIGIGSDVYEIQGGGGGSSYNGALDWSGMMTVATSLDASGIDFTPDKDGVIIASGYSEDTFVPIVLQITGVSKEIYLTVSQNSYTSEYFPLNKGIQIHISRGTSSIPLTDIDIYFVPFKIGYNSGDTMCEVLFNTPASTDAWVNPVVVSCIPLNYDLITFEVGDNSDGLNNLLMFTPQSVELDNAAGDYTKGYKLQSGANAYLSRIENAVKMFTSTGTTLTLNKVIGYKFGKGEYYSPIIYSTEEREIGVWKDNKPLYQKTFVGTTDNQQYFIPNTSYIETLVSVNGYMSKSEWDYELPFHDGYDFISITNNETNGARLYTSSYFVGLPFVATLQYTKKTDVPGSGQYNTLGVPTVHYSTDEHIIGTDENNNTIYEKTITGSVTSTNTQIDISSLNIDDLIDMKARYRSDTINMRFINEYADGDDWLSTHIYRNNIRILCTSWFVNNDFNAKITLQYTKTTS